MPQCALCWRQASYLKKIPDGKWWWQWDRVEYLCSGHAHGIVISLRTSKEMQRTGKFYVRKGEQNE